MNHEEADIHARVLNGDPLAYRQLFDRCYGILCKQAAFQLRGDMEEAEDVVQQVFIDFWTQEKCKAIDISVFAYLRKMVQFKSIDHIRKKMTRVAYETDYASYEAPAKIEPPASSEVHQALQQAIAELPEQCRNIFSSVYLEGKKYKEAALEYHVSINTVKEQLRRATGKLRLKLKDFIMLTILMSPFMP
jgi:RNA polymerase sigma-70 factor (ECF subfamily)